MYWYKGFKDESSGDCLSNTSEEYQDLFYTNIIDSSKEQETETFQVFAV